MKELDDYMKYLGAKKQEVDTGITAYTLPSTYIIEARSLDQGYPVSKTITANSEKEARKIFEDDFGDGLDLINIFKV